jgi:hypothetical protein
LIYLFWSVATQGFAPPWSGRRAWSQWGWSESWRKLGSSLGPRCFGSIWFDLAAHHTFPTITIFTENALLSPPGTRHQMLCAWYVNGRMELMPNATVKSANMRPCTEQLPDCGSRVLTWMRQLE